jgi:biopolymer transport protein TolR
MGASVAKSDGTRRRRGRGSRGTRPMSEINVTPFVDVMLCLLIIFMVAAPLMTVGVPIDLPDTSAEALPSEEEEPLTVTLTPEGDCHGADDRGADERAGRASAGRRGGAGLTRIFLRADGAIPYERVMTVMGALNAGGFREIGLVTDSGGPRLDGSVKTDPGSETAMRRSLYASSAIHAGILLWVAFGGALFRDSPETEFEVTGVTILSVSEFEALTTGVEPTPVVLETPVAPPQVEEAAAPEAPAPEEAPPPVEQPEEAPEPEPDPAARAARARSTRGRSDRPDRGPANAVGRAGPAA